MSITAVDLRVSRQDFHARIEGFEPKFTDPPITQLPPTTVSSFGGSVLVRRTRSLAGENTRKKRSNTVRTLKLGDIGRCSIVPDSRRHPQTGQAIKIQHLLNVSRLPAAVPRGSCTIEVVDGVMFVTNSNGGGVKTFYEDYTDSTGPGETVVIGDGEYIQVESSERGTSVSWTSELPLREVLKQLEVLVNSEQSDSGESYLQIVDMQGNSLSTEGEPKEIIDYVLSEDPEVSYISLQYQSMTLAWSPPSERVKWSKHQLSEIGLVSAKLRYADIRPMLEATASPAVSKSYSDMFSRMKNVDLKGFDS